MINFLFKKRYILQLIFTSIKTKTKRNYKLEKIDYSIVRLVTYFFEIN
jgi:hypothetical protein